MPTRRRETYEGRQTLCPQLAMLGWTANRSAADLPLAAHTHYDAFEVCLIHRGSVEWWVGEEVYEIGPGDVFVTRPGEEHGGVGAVIQPCELYWMQVRPAARGPQAALSRDLAGITCRCFPGPASLHERFRELLREHRRRDARSRLAAQSLVLRMVIDVLRAHDDHQRARRRAAERLSPQIAAAMQAIRQQLDEDLPVSYFAEAAQLSVTRFHERFREETGYAPHEWRMRQRVDRARQLLRQPGRTITDVAMRCGFGTSQYFATAFRKMVGLSPGDYRRWIESGSASRSSPGRT